MTSLLIASEHLWTNQTPTMLHRSMTHDVAEKLILAITENNWHLQWQILATDSWFRHKLLVVALWTLKNRHQPTDRVDDVVQQALLELAKSLQSSGGLRFDANKGDVSAFLSGVARRICSKAFRQFRVDLTQTNNVADLECQAIDQHSWLSEAIDQLPHLYRQHIQLLSAGHSAKEIARLKGQSLRTTYRYLEHAKRQLRQFLSDM